MTTIRWRYDSILRAVASTPWAIDPAKGQAILDLLALRASGGRVDAETVAAIAAQNRRPAERVAGRIAVLPVYGVIAPRMNSFGAMSGGTSSEGIAKRVDALAAEPEIGAIVLDIDSPGGTVQGLPELIARINAAKTRKPVVAVANHLAASAAYWIAATADEVYVTPSGEVGSIGVYTAHFDYSAAMEQEGVKATLISAGKYKLEGNPYEPLTEEARAEMQASVDAWYAQFTSAVAKGRGVSVQDVRSGFGEGRIVNASDAVQMGMADGIATLDEVLARLTGPSLRRAAGRAAALGSSLDTERLAARRAGQSDAPADDEERDPNEPEPDDDEDDKDDDEPDDDEQDDDAATTTRRQQPSDAAGGAAGADLTLPAATAPAAKEHTVPNDTTAAHDPAAATEARFTAFLTLARDHGKGIQDVTAWMTAGKTVAQVKDDLLAEKAARATPIITGVRDRDEGREFATFGEQLVAIVQAGRPGGRFDPRLSKVNARVLAAASGMNESVGSEGGFFIQPELLPGVLTPVYEDDPILSRVTRIPIGGGTNAVKFNVVDETSRANGSRWGGIQVYWAAEADTVTAKKPKMRQEELALHKIMAIGYLTDEMVQDAPAAEALLANAFATEMRFVLADTIWRGEGVGKPLGFLNSGAVVSQAIEGGQTLANSNQYIATNIAKMLAHIPASLWGQVIWIYNQELLATLVTAVVGTGGSAVPVFLGANGISGRPYDTILGRPAFASELAEAPGTPGDLVAVVPSQYLLGEKGGPQMAQSIHVRFLNDEMTMRITYRVGGMPVWRQGITPYKGALTRSPIVTLAARA